MKRFGVPTAPFYVAYDFLSAMGIADSLPTESLVCKDTEMVSRQGVYIFATKLEAIRGVEALFTEASVPRRSKPVIIEKYFEGPELSIVTLTDGTTHGFVSVEQLVYQRALLIVSLFRKFMNSARHGTYVNLLLLEKRPRDNRINWAHINQVPQAARAS